jgi:hypothetical protein
LSLYETWTIVRELRKEKRKLRGVFSLQIIAFHNRSSHRTEGWLDGGLAHKSATIQITAESIYGFLLDNVKVVCLSALELDPPTPTIATLAEVPADGKVLRVIQIRAC